MSPAQELLDLVEQAAAALRLADGSVGTAFVLLGDTLARLQQRSPGELVGKPAQDVARLFAADDPVERALGLPLTVVELRAELVKEEPGLTVTLDPTRLAACNKIVSTSTVLLNNTLEQILSHCRHAEELALVGPSASCFPEPLFARGVTTMGGYWVLDPAVFMRRAAALEPWGDAGKKSSVRRSAYPGTQTLLRKAA